MTVELTREEIKDIICTLKIYRNCPYYNSLIKHRWGREASEPSDFDAHCCQYYIEWRKNSQGWDKFTDESLWKIYQGLKRYHNKIM